MKNLASSFVVCSIFALSTSPAFADPAAAHDIKEARQNFSEKGAEYFKNMDTSGDGMISKEEFDVAHDKHFHDMDTNGDSKLSRDEMRAGHSQTLKKAKGKRFDEADTNDDGALTRDEAKNMPRILKRFDKIDSNKDGKLTREEMDATLTKRRPEGE